VLTARLLSSCAGKRDRMAAAEPFYVDGVNATWCQRSGHDVDDGWASNHCAHEHVIWILGQIILFFAYWAGYLSTMYNIRRYKYIGLMRLGIIISAIFLVSWASAVAKARDQMAYQIVILIVNFFHLLYLAQNERPITLNDYLHNLWHKMFNMNGYNLELMDFYNLMQEKAFLKTYKRGQVYITEGDYPQQLSILLSGQMSVYKRDDWQRKSLYMAHKSTAIERRKEENDIGAGIHGNNAYCGAVYPYEFIDSYEWLMCQGVFKYDGLSAPAFTGVSQVTIGVSDAANITECVVLTWKKEMLESIFKEHPRLRVCIHSLVGKDIADKMLRICGHSVRVLTPDVDMVRKSHSFLRPTLRADVKNAHQTDLERQVLPIPANRAATILDDEYTQTYENEARKTEILAQRPQPVVRNGIYDCALENGEVLTAEGLFKNEVKNMTSTQKRLKLCIGAGPWCDLSDAKLMDAPWKFAPMFLEEGEGGLQVSNSDINERSLDRAEEEQKYHKHLLEQAMHSLQRARLRITNSRLLGMNPGALESLQPSSDMQEQNKFHSGQLLEYFELNMPELKPKDLHEILKWGRWRTFYRPGTVLVRQGEEAHYVGLVLQGRLALYTEDEITRTKILVTYVDKFDLVGSEDFSSKFRTARRTCQMPRYEAPQDSPSHKPPQLLEKTIMDVPWEEKGNEADREKLKKEAMMYEEMTKADAKDWIESNEALLTHADKQYMEDVIKTAENSDDETPVLVTKIPTIMYMWDIKDLKRLMLADPHVESSLSTLLRSDITFKLNMAAPSALGTRLCGVPTMARGDQDIRMCAITND